MNVKNKNILVLGLGISGVATAKALNKLGANVLISDNKSEEQLKEYMKQIKDIDIDYILGSNDVKLSNIDLIVKSPGIKNNIPIIQKAIDMNIEVITDIEIGYRLFNNKIIAITGTNGKTTTTTLVGEIFNNTEQKVHVTGNIGVGLLWELVNSAEDDIFVIETSSFQLDNTKEFKPKISAITNITPDHIDWHGNFENYVKAKKKIFKNQDEKDYTILNYDDKELRNIPDTLKSNIIWFSQENKLQKGIFILDNHIVYSDGKKTIAIVNINDIKVPGRHNIENIMTAVAISLASDVDLNIIRKTITEFEGIEHRLEFVDDIDGTKYYNDSKGTNPVSSIKAIEALEYPIVLIAGGYDKGSDYSEFIDSFKGKVKDVILLGETKEKISEAALKIGFNNIYFVSNMNEAVNKSFEISKRGTNVLLSPACASWDMYESYEKRGIDFKNCVSNIRRLHNAKKGK